MEDDAKTTIEQFFRQYNSLQVYKKGQILLLSNETPVYAYFLVKGRVKQYAITYRGNEIVVNVIKPGSYFMILTALTGLPNYYCFSAETDVSLLRAPAKEVAAFINTHHGAMQAMLTTMHGSLENLLHRMAHLMNGSARGRVIYEILLDVKGQANRSLSITEMELASRAGLSRETVSREVSYLKKKGILATSSRITILNLAKLEKVLEDSL